MLQTVKLLGAEMITPWGELSALDLSDHELAATILSADKHQLIEGLTVESLFDQIVASVPSIDQNVLPLDVDSTVVDTRRPFERWIVFVWARSRTAGLGRYLQALENSAVPYLVEYKDGEFLATRISKGKRTETPRILTELMHDLSGGKMTPFVVDESVRDKKRQKTAFWGFISDYYKDRLGDRVILPRILINCAIQPYFRAVWNLDRIFIAGNDIWIFEIKHKYPIDKKPLLFGINDGELGMLEMLINSQIRCLHTILVKPYWSLKAGSMYLFNNLDMRNKAAIIAIVLDQSETARIMKQPSKKSGSHTSLTGVDNQSYKEIPAYKFTSLGVLSDPAIEVAKNMTSVMFGQETNKAKDDWLRRLRVQNIGN